VQDAAPTSVRPFADNDPINGADPDGLCPKPKRLCEPRVLPDLGVTGRQVSTMIPVHVIDWGGSYWPTGVGDLLRPGGGAQPGASRARRTAADPSNASRSECYALAGTALLSATVDAATFGWGRLAVYAGKNIAYVGYRGYAATFGFNALLSRPTTGVIFTKRSGAHPS